MKFFNPKIFDLDYVLIHELNNSGKSLCVPDETLRDKLLNWTNNIPSAHDPSWIGLPNDADELLLTVRGEIFFYNFIRKDIGYKLYKFSFNLNFK